MRFHFFNNKTSQQPIVIHCFSWALCFTLIRINKCLDDRSKRRAVSSGIAHSSLGKKQSLRTFLDAEVGMSAVLPSRIARS